MKTSSDAWLVAELEEPFNELMRPGSEISLLISCNPTGKKKMQSNGCKSNLNMRATFCWATRPGSQLNLHTIKIKNGRTTGEKQMYPTHRCLIDQFTMASSVNVTETNAGLFSYTCQLYRQPQKEVVREKKNWPPSITQSWCPFLLEQPRVIHAWR